jgi:hypothetical protein
MLDDEIFDLVDLLGQGDLDSPKVEGLVVTAAEVLRTEAEDMDYTDFVEGEVGHQRDLEQDALAEDNYLEALAVVRVEDMDSSCHRDVEVWHHILVDRVDVTSVAGLVGSVGAIVDVDGQVESFLSLGDSFCHLEDIHDGVVEP